MTSGNSKVEKRELELRIVSVLPQKKKEEREAFEKWEKRKERGN